MDGQKSRKWSRRTVVIAAVVAMLASTGGFALAQVLSVTTVQHGSEYYAVSNSPVNGYASPPTLAWTFAPYGPCDSSVVDTSPTLPAVAVLSNSTSGTCTTNDFAAEFTFVFAATLAAPQTNTFTVISEVGPAYDRNNVSVTFDPGTYTNTLVHIFVDFNNPAAPPQGISALNIVVQ